MYRMESYLGLNFGKDSLIVILNQKDKFRYSKAFHYKHDEEFAVKRDSQRGRGRQKRDRKLNINNCS